MKVLVNKDLAVRVIRHAGAWMRDNHVANYSEWWDPDILDVDFLSRYAQPDEFYVLAIEDQPAAATIIQKEQNLQDWSSVDGNVHKDAIYLHYIAVERQFAGKGLVARLVEKAKELAKEQKVPVIRLDTDANEPKLCSLYESLGFVCVKKVRDGSQLVALYEKAV